MLKKYSPVSTVLLVMVLVAVAASGCDGQVSQSDPAPNQLESDQAGAQDLGFKGPDLISGQQIAYTPEQSSRPAIIMFFSPG